MADNDETNVGFTQKQKAMAAGVVIILAILAWQIYGLVSGNGGDESIVPAKAPPQGAKPPGQMTNTSIGSTPPATPMTTTSNIQMPATTTPQSAAKEPVSIAPSNAEILKKQKEQQEKYLTTVNQLQMLKLERDIAETNQAISAAKLATATAEKNINDLLIPAKPTPPPPATSYASTILSQTSTQASPPPVDGNAPTSPPPQVVVETVVPYVVISVSMQLNKWTAVLGANGKLLNVSKGDVLADGWVVGLINRDGVVLKKNGVSKKVSLVPSL